MRSLLWITPKWPLPADDGARVASANLLKNLTKLGESIHLISCVAPEESPSEEEAKEVLGVTGCSIITRASAQGTKLEKAFAVGTSFLRDPLVPVTMRFFAESATAKKTSEAVARLSRDALAKGNTPYVVYDGLHTAAHSVSKGLYRAEKSLPPVIYRAHNREADLWSRRAVLTTSPLEKLFLKLQHIIVRRFEDSLVKQALLTATVSDDDLLCFQTAAPDASLVTVPIGFDFTSPLPLPQGEELVLAFLGRLDWHPNRDGLIWFLKEVWPEAVKRRPQLQLLIAGSGDGSAIQELVKQKNISFLGRVESVEEFFASSNISIVPLFYGSGTRVKVITACALGRASLSTALGVEGVGLTPGESYLRAETAEEWIDQLTSLSSEEARVTGLAAFRDARERFDNEVAAVSFRAKLEELSVHGR